MTFKQLRPALYRWAKHFQCQRFEFWELINAVWAQGKAQNLQNKRYISRCIKFGMIDYMREISAYRTKKRWEESGQFYPVTMSISQRNEDNEDFQLEAKKEHCKVETDDLLKMLLKGLNDFEKLIINLKYKKDYTWGEIAQMVGLSEEQVYSMNYRALKQIYKKAVRMGIGRKYLGEISFRATKRRNSTEYSRMHYSLNKARIKKQRMARKAVA